MLKRIDLTRDYHKHKAEYMAAIEAVCEETAFSGGRFRGYALGQKIPGLMEGG